MLLGGIAGMAATSSDVSNCTNRGVITSTSNNEAGGICGRVDASSKTNVQNGNNTNEYTQINSIAKESELE